MSTAYSIRLHAAWKRVETTPPAANGDGPQPLTVHLPDDSLPLLAATAVQYRRQFHRPSGLGPGDRVALVSGLLPLASQIVFNGQPIAAEELAPADDDGTSKLPLTDRLLDYNELQLHIHCDYFEAASRCTARLVIWPAD